MIFVLAHRIQTSRNKCAIPAPSPRDGFIHEASGFMYEFPSRRHLPVNIVCLHKDSTSTLLETHAISIVAHNIRHRPLCESVQVHHVVLTAASQQLPSRKHGVLRGTNAPTSLSSCCRDASELRRALYNESSEGCSSPGAGTPWSESGEMVECLKTLEEPWETSII
ncbi:hypothetical protein AB1N83_000890 [Pleurotus pulmonarius]